MPHRVRSPVVSGTAARAGETTTVASSASFLPFPLASTKPSCAATAADPAAVEKEYRALLAGDPASAAALEALAGWLTQAGRSREVSDLSLEAASRQPQNQANNLRAALVAAERGDSPAEIRLLRAAVQSGPVNSGVELRLARLLYASGDRSEAWLRLAEAARISTYEGDPDTSREIARLIDMLRAKEAAR